MAVYVLDCTDCHTTLRIRDPGSVIPLHCPRCGEHLNPSAAKPKNGRPGGSRKSRNHNRAASSPPVALASTVGRTNTGQGLFLSLLLVTVVFGIVAAGFFTGYRYLTRERGSNVVVAGGSSTAARGFRPPRIDIPQRPTSNFPGGLPGMPALGQSGAGSRQMMNSTPPVSPAPPVTAAPMVSSTQPVAPQPRQDPSRPQDTGDPSGGIAGSFPGRSPAGLGAERRPGFPRGPRFPAMGGPPRGFPGAPPTTNPAQPSGNDPPADNSTAGITPPPRLATPDTPLPDLLRILDESSGGARSLPLRLLSRAEPNNALREKVLTQIANDLTEDNPFLRQMASAVFCRWAGPEQSAQLLTYLQNSDPFLRGARIEAMRSLGRFRDPKHYAVLIQLLEEPSLQRETREVLTDIGSDLEPFLLEAFPQLQDRLAKRSTLEVLREIGTAKSLPMLQKLAESPDFSVRPSAISAVNAVRARIGPDEGSN